MESLAGLLLSVRLLGFNGSLHSAPAVQIVSRPALKAMCSSNFLQNTNQGDLSLVALRSIR